MDIALELLTALTEQGNIKWVAGPGPIVNENESTGIHEPTMKGPSVTVTAANWHFHIRPERVAAIQFVVADAAHGELRMYYVKLVNDQSENMLRAFFPSPYMDEDDNAADFQPEKLNSYEEFRDRFVGRDGIDIASAPNITPSPGLARRPVSRSQERRVGRQAGEAPQPVASKTLHLPLMPCGGCSLAPWLTFGCSLKVVPI